jgi:hypothetical protein
MCCRIHLGTIFKPSLHLLSSGVPNTSEIPNLVGKTYNTSEINNLIFKCTKFSVPSNPNSDGMVAHTATLTTSLKIYTLSRSANHSTNEVKTP